MSLQKQLRPLLQQFTTALGRGNLMVANGTMVRIVEMMAVAIDAPCGCTCASKPTEVAIPLPVVKPLVVGKRGRGRPKKLTA